MRKLQEEKKKGNKGLIVLVIVVLLIVGLFLTRKVGEGVLSQVLSRLTKESVKVETNGDSISSENSLPEGFPEDFPIYAEVKIVSSFKATQGETDGTSVIWETEDDATKVAGYYKEELAKKGWKIISTFEAEGSTTVTFEKGEVSGFLGITKGEGGKTAISVTLGVKEE